MAPAPHPNHNPNLISSTVRGRSTQARELPRGHIALLGCVTILSLEDPSVPIDTNHLEREIRPIPLGRKNWMFCWTELGARTVGRIQSLLATCLLHQVDPYVYLVDLLQRIDSHPVLDVHLLTPRLWKQHLAADPLGSDLSDSRKNAED